MGFHWAMPENTRTILAWRRQTPLYLPILLLHISLRISKSLLCRSKDGVWFDLLAGLLGRKNNRLGFGWYLRAWQMTSKTELFACLITLLCHKPLAGSRFKMRLPW